MSAQRFSFNQVEHSARKAARGVGVAWGLAEDTGRAVRWLEAIGLEGVPALVQLLDHIDASSMSMPALASTKQDGRWRGLGPGATLVAGAAIADCIVAGSTACCADRGARLLTVENLGIPVLCLGFAGAAAGQSGHRAWLNWDDVDVEITETSAALQGSRSAIGAAVGTVSLSLECPRSFRADTRFAMQEEAETAMTTVDPDTWHTLQRFAHRTYVPATEASRLGGAGAGTLDND